MLERFGLGVASGVLDDFLRLTIVIAEYMFGNDLVFKKDGYDHCLGWKSKKKYKFFNFFRVMKKTPKKTPKNSEPRKTPKSVMFFLITAQKMKIQYMFTILTDR